MAGHTTHDGVSPTYVAPAIYRQATVPESTILGDLWLDMSLVPAVLKQYTATGWEAVSGGGGGATLVEVEVDLSTTKPRDSGSFTIASSGLTAGKMVAIQKANGPYTGKGTLSDEAEMDSVQVTGKVTDATTIQCYWSSSTLVKGNHKFHYLVGA